MVGVNIGLTKLQAYQALLVCPDSFFKNLIDKYNENKEELTESVRFALEAIEAIEED